MPLSLIVGPPNSGRAGEAQARFLAGLAEDPLLVVPTADDAARFERELCGEGKSLIEFAAGELDAVGRGLEELKLDELIARLEADS